MIGYLAENPFETNKDFSYKCCITMMLENSVLEDRGYM